MQNGTSPQFNRSHLPDSTPLTHDGDSTGTVTTTSAQAGEARLLNPAAPLEPSTDGPSTGAPPANTPSTSSGRTRKAALLVTGSTGISALIGIANGLISARLFGVSRAMDAYLIAVIVPQLLGFLFGIRLSVFLVPWLISMRHAKGAVAARKMEWRLGLLFPLCTTLLLGLSFAFGEAVVRLLAPEFPPDKAAIAVALLRWTVPGGVAIVAMAILTSIAHSHQRFWGASMAGVINPLVTFLLLVSVGKLLGVQTIAMGFFLGPLLGCLPILWSLRGSLREQDETPSQWSQVPAFQMVFLLGLMTTAHNQIPLIVARRIASDMQDGVISGLQYATQFSWMPVTILATSVGTALLPSMVEKHQRTKEGLDEKALLDAARAMRVLAYLLVPLSFLIWFFAFPVVSLALSGGAFDKQAVIVTSEAMRYYVPLIWIGAIWAILLKIVQARNALRVLFEALLLGTIIDVAAMYGFKPFLGYLAIPLAGSANYIFVTIYVLIRTRSSVRLPMREIGRSMAILTGLALAACMVAKSVQPWTLAPITGLIYAATYTGLAHLFRVREQEDFWTLVLGKAARKFLPASKPAQAA